MWRTLVIYRIRDHTISGLWCHLSANMQTFLPLSRLSSSVSSPIIIFFNQKSLDYLAPKYMPKWIVFMDKRGHWCICLSNYLTLIKGLTDCERCYLLHTHIKDSYGKERSKAGKDSGQSWVPKWYICQYYYLYLKAVLAFTYWIVFYSPHVGSKQRPSTFHRNENMQQWLLTSFYWYMDSERSWHYLQKSHTY